MFPLNFLSCVLRSPIQNLLPVHFRIYHCLLFPLHYACLSHWVYFGFRLVFLVYSLCPYSSTPHCVLIDCMISRCALCAALLTPPLVFPCFPCRCSRLFPAVFVPPSQLALPRAYLVVCLYPFPSSSIHSNVRYTVRFHIDY